MKKDITPNLCNSSNKGKKVVVPSADTLSFLKQFARSYYVERGLPESISGICVN